MVFSRREYTTPGDDCTRLISGEEFWPYTTLQPGFVIAFAAKKKEACAKAQASHASVSCNRQSRREPLVGTLRRRWATRGVQTAGLEWDRYVV
jgi:hypothetical protein